MRNKKDIFNIQLSPKELADGLVKNHGPAKALEICTHFAREFFVDKQGQQTSINEHSSYYKEVVGLINKKLITQVIS